MTEPRKLSAKGRSGPDDRVEIVSIYVCPKCKSYFASSSMMVPLENQVNIAVGGSNVGAGTIVSTRDKCPTIGCTGKRVRRLARLISEEEVNQIKREAHLDTS